MHILRTTVAALLLPISLLVPCLHAQTHTAADILREFDRLSFPSMSRDASPEGAARFRAEVREIARRKCELANDLFELDPDNARMADLIGKRWALMINSLQLPADVLTEADAFLKNEALRDDLRREALLARTRGLLATDAAPPACLRAIQALLEVDPKSTGAGLAIMELLRTRDIPPQACRELVTQVQKSWPDDKWISADAKGFAGQLDRIGKPLDLAFDDILGSGEVRSDTSPCPHTLAIYWSTQMPADFDAVKADVAARKGLRTIGVVTFRNKDGVAAVTEQLKARGIDWPHCYDEAKIGNPFESAYRTPRTPFYYLLDDKGVVVRFAYEWAVMRRILDGLKIGRS